MTSFPIKCRAVKAFDRKGRNEQERSASELTLDGSSSRSAALLASVEDPVNSEAFAAALEALELLQPIAGAAAKRSLGRESGKEV